MITSSSNSVPGLKLQDLCRIYSWTFKTEVSFITIILKNANQNVMLLTLFGSPWILCEPRREIMINKRIVIMEIKAECSGNIYVSV